MNNTQKWLQLKKVAGSHSPSIATIKSEFPDLHTKVDACFLSNPYATSLFFDYARRDLIEKPNEFMRLLEYYPSQNAILAKLISDFIGVDSSNILVCNGAIDAIERVIQNLKGSFSIPIPTFSSYYEFARKGLDVRFFQLQKTSDYKLDLSDYQDFIISNKIDNILLINPNNPTGQGFSKSEIENFISDNVSADSIIIDESFIHFNDECDPNIQSASALIKKFPNLFIIKSMSKDFGIAGIRLGYLVANDKWIKDILKHGALWNINGMSEYFLRLFSDSKFQTEYENARKYFLKVHIRFGNELRKLKGFKVIPSTANFYLCEVTGDVELDSVVSDLIFDSGIYVRNCSDKIGLIGKYIRIASRTEFENEYMIEVFKKMFN